MKNESYLTGCKSTLLAIILIPLFVYLIILLYGKYHTSDRSYVADIKSVRYEISFTEIEHDSILAFSFHQKGDDKKKNGLFVYNSSWDVVSFIFTKDTIYIRDEMEFHDLFPYEERDEHSIPPADFKKGKIIKGYLPSFCRIIPFSDSRFFVYDSNRHKYVLKDSTIHMINLVHDIERANDYHIFDENLKDTLEICLNECDKQ